MKSEKYEKKHVIARVYDNGPLLIWTHNGRHAFAMREDERKIPLDELVDQILDMYEYNKYRCSRCKGDFDWPPAGYPLFAGITCPDCWREHQEHLEKQRRKGHVCPFCRQPYDACCC